MNTGLSTVFQVVGRHRWPALATFASVLCSAALYIAVTPSLYESTTRIMISGKQLSVSELGSALTDLPSAPGASPIATQVELTRSQRVLKRALDKVASESSGKLPTIDVLKDDLKVSILPATGILELTYRNAQSDVAAKVLNAIADAMVATSSEDIRSEARAVRQFLEKEVPLKKAALKRAELAESQTKRATGIVALAAQTKGDVESLAALQDQVQSLSAQIQESKVRTESLKNLTAMSDLKNAYASLKVSQNESLKALRVKLADLEAQVALNRTRLGDQHPDMLALVAQRDEMRANYLSQVKQLLPKGVSPQRVETSASGELSQELFGKLILSDIERPALESRLTLVQASRKQLQAQLQQLPQREQELVELMRQREVAASALSTLQNKLEEARVAEAQLIGNITIIDRATSTDKPKWPSKIVILIIAGVVGFILVVGIILILEALDGTLRNATEAESLLKMPVLGVLPILPSNAISMVKPDAFLGELNTVESFRTLLKTLEFRSYGKLKVIVVSSTLAQEGKSVVASHLASVAAMLSRNTLLIDADMRMPTQDTLFGLEQKPGLSDCLVGRVSLKQIINETAMENLAVITAGQMHPQPSQLLESSRLKVLLAEASRYFDLIIIDSPPLTSCSDAATLSSYSDGLLMIARPNFTPKDLLQKAIADLQTNHCNVLGVAINGMNAQTELYYRGSRKMLTS
jgi:polysaccharide biosynthesis transport protein